MWQHSIWPALVCWTNGAQVLDILAASYLQQESVKLQPKTKPESDNVKYFRILRLDIIWCTKYIEKFTCNKRLTDLFEIFLAQICNNTMHKPCRLVFSIKEYVTCCYFPNTIFVPKLIVSQSINCNHLFSE